MLVLIWSLLIALVQGQDSGNVFKPDPLTPGPWVKMSHGAIWPRPAQQSSWPNFFVLDPKSFKLQVGFYWNPIYLCKGVSDLETCMDYLKKKW